MNNLLLAPAPGFEQPLEVLEHCHDRIRKQIRTMQNLLVHLPKRGADAEARRAAENVVRYFSVAAHHHHADEEENLLPMLHAAARGDDAAVLSEILPQIMADHVQMGAAWSNLERQLRAIAAGESAALEAQDVERFARLYAEHMEKEESVIAPMARRLFGAAQMTALGDAMRERRGVREPASPTA
ncbi:MAG TPA: hemerythrin domain-containing protein [Paucimonas sp.]|nr:hemerythrin domain-containing protein [Paucimonas sp.]